MGGAKNKEDFQRIICDTDDSEADKSLKVQSKKDSHPQHQHADSDQLNFVARFNEVNDSFKMHPAEKHPKLA